MHIHVLVRRVSELKHGVYEYEWNTHSLKLLDDKSPEGNLTGVGIGEQPWLEESAVVIALGANFDGPVKYFESQLPRGERGVRYVFMESGAAAQNAHLQATALGLGFVLVAGFDDAKAKNAFQFAPGFEPTALFCIGQRDD
ncbi:hypothetical protein L861_01455 [Litchfieldella anticariensis FP35 = DSM 16096]|uniref:Nitroreductase domain-containing protein n=1 Tax=Litchfieldella anticariensis (strain DSM 16096 / CECT 5854 / CIP 108499 / LMG 22089 / FP35) TaxID=1121939 RepID=S2KPH5_LITA3|nr:hypothetical protein L861_01455 [Halomonas anticariensis FP35 = DSM 16096]